MSLTGERSSAARSNNIEIMSTQSGKNWCMQSSGISLRNGKTKEKHSPPREAMKSSQEMEA